MWFLTPSPAHTCFRLGTREWLLVYTCVSAQKPQGSCTNTAACYPCVAVALVCSGIPTAGRRHPYITESNDCHNTPTSFFKINWWTDEVCRCQVRLNWCQAEFTVCVVRILPLSIYMPVSMLRSLHCHTHLFHVNVQYLCETWYFLPYIFKFYVMECVSWCANVIYLCCYWWSNSKIAKTSTKSIMNLLWI